MNKKLIKSQSIFILLALLGISALSACATSKFYHKYIMRGSIVEARGSKYYLCIGTKDGAQAGQVLNVYRIFKTQTFDVDAIITGLDGMHYNLKKELVGKVKILKKVDEHFAIAEVIEGRARTGYIVELR